MSKNILYFTRTMGMGGTENVVLQLCEIMKKNNNVVVCSCGGINVEKLNNMGIKHYTIPDIEKKDPITIILTLRMILKVIREEKIDIVHTHHRMAAFYTRLLGKKRNIRYINTCHNTFDNKKMLTKFSYKRIELIACGEMVKKNLVEIYNIDSNRISVIYNSVKEFNNNVNEIEIIKRLKEENYLLVGNIGRLSTQKGMEYFIKALPLIIKENKKVKFLIIGEGEKKEELIEIAESIGVIDNVIFMGYRNDIQNIMIQLDLIVLTSLWEGLPLTPIEAFSVGKTIVATAVDGTVEIVDNEINGVLVESKNVKEIASKINELLLNDERRYNLGLNAKAKYEEKFSFESFCKKYKNYYNEIKDN
ncbi:glycosyltransferase family 4 protein [Clostridium perfringens]|nr:glycosyltransferase family 4 protein [Clostridium perfringens]MDM0991510.1 glycosyltransferase family 4 protein [Clostridium perfringens]